MGVTHLLTLDLGDGQEIVSDYPPDAVIAAALRLRAALDEGREPDCRDSLRVFRWLEEQDVKHGGISRS